MGNGFRLGDWQVDPDLNRLSRPGHEIKIEPKVMDVLVFMASHPGEVLSRETILQEVWSGTHVTDEVLTYSVFELRKALDDDARHPRIIQTIPRRGYRLIAAVARNDAGQDNGNRPREAPREEATEPDRLPLSAPSPPVPVPAPVFRPMWHWAAAGVACLLLACILLWLQFRPASLTSNDTILLAEIVNATGDPVFDGTLKHALAIHLSQTPFLNIFPEERVRETLQFMGQPADAAVTREIGREICVRRGLAAMLAGTIATLGRDFVISIEAIEGQSGEVIAREQVVVDSKEKVLVGLGGLATRLRRELGESIGSLERFDVPLEQATTSSLEAFKAYSTGRRYLVQGRMAEAIPHYLRALDHDSRFASAYDDLAWCYDGLAQHDKAAESATKAFELRDRVSEYERLSIASIYYTMATGELDRAIETLEMMRSTYPRSAPVHNTLGGRYLAAGLPAKAAECFREAIRLNRHPNAYGGLASAYLRLNRLQDAKNTIAEARSEGFDNRALRSLSYVIAFAQSDPVAMIEQMRWSAGRPDEAFMLSLQAAAASSGGHLEQAREFYRRATATARRFELGDAVAEFTAELARTEAVFGNCSEALSASSVALESSRDWRVLIRAMYALCACGKPDEAEARTNELAALYPSHTIVQNHFVPSARAAVALARGDAGEALKILQTSSALRPTVSLWPAYSEATAYLHRGSGKEARAAFQRILDDGGMDLLSPVRPLARLGYARACALTGDYQASRKAYDEFFTAWKTADTDLPIFRRALAEYAGLRKPIVEGIGS
jgi:eukaryotic-like serine/threonine-protein kinase